MRSISPNIVTSPTEGKQRAGWTRLAVLLAAGLLSACAGPSGVRNTAHSFNTVVVDAGHGGYDAGTRSSRAILEKDAALDVALRLDTKLKAAGLTTVLTRKDDTFIPLDTRNVISNREQNAVFVSIHFNESRPKPGVHGTETYYNARQAVELAQSILQKMSAIPGGAGRFSKTERFRVLRNNRNPAVLVECAYLSNRSDASRAASPENREQMAGAIAEAIVAQKR